MNSVANLWFDTETSFDGYHQVHVLHAVTWRRRVLLGRERHSHLCTADRTAVADVDLAQFAFGRRGRQRGRHRAQHARADLPHHVPQQYSPQNAHHGGKGGHFGQSTWGVRCPQSVDRPVENDNDVTSGSGQRHLVAATRPPSTNTRPATIHHWLASCPPGTQPR